MMVLPDLRWNDFELFIVCKKSHRVVAVHVFF